MPPSKTNRTSRQKDKTASTQAATSADKPSPARKARPVAREADATESSSLTNHRKAAGTPFADTTVIAPPRAVATAAAAGSGASSVKSSALTESLSVMEASQPLADVLMPEVTTAQIAELAHSYYVARGHQHGSADEDWHRAERELRKN